MNSLKKKDLKSKFGKFAVSAEKMAKVKGGVMALCTGGGEEWIISSNTVDGLQALVDRDGGDCTTV